MRVERADVNAVKNRIEQLKQKCALKAANALLPETLAIDEYDSRLHNDLLEKEAMKLKWKNQAEAKKRELQIIKELENAANKEVNNAALDDDFEATMGFNGFSTSKK